MVNIPSTIWEEVLGLLYDYFVHSFDSGVLSHDVVLSVMFDRSI